MTMPTYTSTTGRFRTYAAPWTHWWSVRDAAGTVVASGREVSLKAAREQCRVTIFRLTPQPSPAEGVRWMVRDWYEKCGRDPERTARLCARLIRCGIREARATVADNLRE